MNYLAALPRSRGGALRIPKIRGAVGRERMTVRILKHYVHLPVVLLILLRKSALNMASRDSYSFFYSTIFKIALMISSASA